MNFQTRVDQSASTATLQAEHGNGGPLGAGDGARGPRLPREQSTASGPAYGDGAAGVTTTSSKQ